LPFCVHIPAEENFVYYFIYQKKKVAFLLQVLEILTLLPFFPII